MLFEKYIFDHFQVAKTKNETHSVFEFCPVARSREVSLKGKA
jgi:hypothetical protein